MDDPLVNSLMSASLRVTGFVAVIEPTFPFDEDYRVEALRGLRVLDTPPEERFDRLTQLAAHVFGVPIALVSLVDSDRQWFKSCVGLDVSQTDRSISFCGHAINQPTTFVVEDAAADIRFADNPLVVGKPFIRFYAGHPLSTPDGFHVGTFCIIDNKPRQFDGNMRMILKEFAKLAEAELLELELNKAIQNQREAVERMRVVGESVRDVIVAINLDGLIVYANGAARALFGDEPDTAPLIGRPAAQVVSDRSPREIAELIERAESGNPIPRLEILARSPSGVNVPLDVTFAFAHLDGRRVYIASGRDLTEQREVQREINRISQQRQLILASSADGIVHIGSDGVIVYANPAAHNLLHVSKDSLVGRHLHDVIHHADSDGHEQSWEESMASLTLTNGKTLSSQRDVYDLTDGSSVTVSFTSAPIIEEGIVTGAVIVFADASQQVELERAKDDFVALVSHELRTPLTSLKGSLGLVIGGVFGPLPTEAKMMLDVAVANTDRLVRLINDILDLRRIDAGRMSLELRAHSLIQIVSDSAAVVEGMYAEREIGLEIRLEQVDDVVVRCDGDRIVQVLINLLGNAAKFSPKGSVVVVTAHVEPDPSTGKAHVRIDVIDNGRGIPKDRLERIFERFEQVESADAHQGSGTGLGLSIARALVEEHGGGLTATSTPGVGSIFSVRLPIEGPEESPAL